MIDLIGYRIRPGEHSSLRISDHPVLSPTVIYPTIEDAKEGVSRILAVEERRYRASLAATPPTPAAIKRAWDDRVGAAALVEYRVEQWRPVWSTDQQRWSTVVARVAVEIEIEQRVAWRDIRQVTRPTESGLEVVHELGEPSAWSEWHRPVAGSGPYVPSFELEILPSTWQVQASKKSLLAWARSAR